MAFAASTSGGAPPRMSPHAELIYKLQDFLTIPKDYPVASAESVLAFVKIPE